MNNNYHTQLDNKNDMLYEVAANNQLLQLPNQMQNFTGTPINKATIEKNTTTTTLPGLNNQLTQKHQIPQLTQTQLQQLQAQQLQTQQLQAAQQTTQAVQQAHQLQQLQAQQLQAQQLQAQQLQALHAQQIQSNKLNQLNQYPTLSQTSHITKNDLDEIELSDPKIETKSNITDNTPQLQPVADPEATKITQQLQKIISQPSQSTPLQTIPPLQSTPSIPQTQITNKKIDNFKPNITSAKTCGKNNTKFEYVVMPIILVVLFIILVYPKTSKIFDKFLPSISSFKGCVFRGLIIAIIYLAVKLMKTPK